MKFQMETTRTILFAIVGSLAAILLIRPWESSQAYQAEVAKTKLQVKVRTIQEFLESSYKYTSLIYDVLSPNPKPDDVRLYQSEVYDRYRSATQQIKLYFKTIPERNFTHIEGLSKSLHDHFAHEKKLKCWDNTRLELKKSNLLLATEAANSLDLDDVGKTHLSDWLWVLGSILVAGIIARMVFRLGAQLRLDRTGGRAE